jgi:flavin reductase (DIM6/NTAB) family NADH-FMN oxidoreductase RutF
MSVELQSGKLHPRHFREVLGHFPTGVAVITSERARDRLLEASQRITGSRWET